MAPIHHHYELNGLAEPKIIVRFWIISTQDYRPVLDYLVPSGAHLACHVEAEMRRVHG
jgi:hypothetical protein